MDFNNNYNATNGTDTGFVTTGTANVSVAFTGKLSSRPQPAHAWHGNQV